MGLNLIVQIHSKLAYIYLLPLSRWHWRHVCFAEPCCCFDAGRGRVASLELLHVRCNNRLCCAIQTACAPLWLTVARPEVWTCIITIISVYSAVELALAFSFLLFRLLHLCLSGIELHLATCITATIFPLISFVSVVYNQLKLTLCRLWWWILLL